MKAAYLAVRYKWGKQETMTLEEWAERLQARRAEKIKSKSRKS
jgi:hypothetical protein